MKVKDEIILKDWITKIVIPMKLKEKLEIYLPYELKDRIIYIDNDCKQQKVLHDIHRSFPL